MEKESPRRSRGTEQIGSSARTIWWWCIVQNLPAKRCNFKRCVLTCFRHFEAWTPAALKIVLVLSLPPSPLLPPSQFHPHLPSQFHPHLPSQFHPHLPPGLIILTLLLSVSATLSVSPVFLGLYFCCSLFLSPLYLPPPPPTHPLSRLSFISSVTSHLGKKKQKKKME